MPRQAQQRIETRPDTEKLQRQPVQAQAAATAVDHLPAYIPEPRDPNLQALLESLQTVSPVIQQKLQDVHDGDANQAHMDRMAGLEAQKDSWAYSQNYMYADGYVNAQEFLKELEAEYATDFDKDSGDIESFIRDRWGEKTKGLQPGSFLAGFNKVMAPGLDKLRSVHHEFQKKAIEQHAEANGMQMLDGVVQASLVNDMMPHEGHIAGMRSFLTEKLGISQHRFNEMLISVCKKWGDEGHQEVYGLLKRDNPDGSPGIYYDPQYKSQIDAAELHAGRVAEANGKKDREERIDKHLYDVFAAETREEAWARFEELKKSGLFDHASDLFKWEGMLHTWTNREARYDQINTEIEFQRRIMEGEHVSYRELANADLTPSQVRGLMQDLKRRRGEDLYMAEEEKRRQQSILRDPGFKADLKYIRAQIAHTNERVDPFSERGMYSKKQAATAEREFTERVLNGEDPEEVKADVIERYEKRVIDFKEPSYMPGAGMQRYDDKEQAFAALERGQLSVDDYKKQRALIDEIARKSERQP